MPIVEHSSLPTFSRLRRMGQTVLTADEAEHQDIRALRCGDLVVPFALETLNSTQSQFHLCRRVSKDEWETEYLG